MKDDDLNLISSGDEWSTKTMGVEKFLCNFTSIEVPVFYTQPVLLSLIWHRNCCRAFRLYAFVTSLLLPVEIHYLLHVLHRLFRSCILLLWLPAYFVTHLIFLHITLIYTYLMLIKDIFNCYYSVNTVYRVLINFNDSVLSLPSTFNHLRSAILCMNVDSYSCCCI